MNLTDEEIRIKVAESLGWEGIRGETGYSTPRARELGDYQAIPNYPEDLNATHKMEATLEWRQFAEYQSNLEKVVQAEWTHHSKFPCHREFATARQRCLAYLKTKGLLP